MKTQSEKSKSSLIQRNQHPFFSKRGENSFLGQNGIQTKIEVGEAGDSFEQEADAVAEKVVSESSADTNQKAEGEKIQNKPLASSITPLVSRKNEDEKNIQREGGENTQNTASPSVESGISESKGSGSPMPTKVREDMENSFGTDFNDVRIHTNPKSEKMNQELGSQAFAHGNDIFFNQNKYNPESREGKKLLAHELTHTVQQSGGVKQKKIQRAEGDRPSRFEGTKGVVEVVSASSYILKIPTLRLPTFKQNLVGSERPLRFPFPAGRSDTQRTIWDNELKNDTSIATKIATKLTDANKLVTINSGDPAVYALKVGGAGRPVNSTNLVLGNAQAIQERLIRPYWNPQGRSLPLGYDVDHKREVQLGGEDTDIDNMWLLEASANRSSGSSINHEKTTKIEGLLAEATGPEAEKIWRRMPNPANGGTYNVEVARINGGLSVTGNPDEHYELNDIKEHVKPLDGLSPLTQAEITSLGLGNANQLTLFTNRAGGKPLKIPWTEGQSSATLNRRFGNVEFHTVTYANGTGGSIVATFFKENGKIEEKNATIPINQLSSVPMTAYVADSDIKNLIRGGSISLFSPIVLVETSLDETKGLVGRARITPSLPFLGSGFEIDLVFNGNDLFIEKTFTAGQIALPPPFRIDSSSLTLSLGTNGVNAYGSVFFGIERVGDGHLEGFVGSDGKFGVRGTFDFDKRLFNNATVSIAYENNELTVSGTIRIPQGKLRGIKTATATVSYSGGTLTATGNAELEIKGLQNGTMNLRYTGQELEVGGTFQLSNEIPRVRSGSVSANVIKRGDEYNVTASGNAQLDIPGLENASISVQYANGNLTIEGSVTYQRGIARGEVTVGATNRPVDASGNPAGDAGDAWSFYGRGELTLTLSPWLQATARVSYSRTGEMEVSGTIGLPSSVDVFDRKEINQRLFTFPTIEIPLLAIPVGPRSIGLVATIGGGIDFTAGIGPGQLQALSATVNYRPGQEDSITLNGHGRFVIPADASLRFFGRAGVGVSAGIGRVTGNIELGGAVGIRGAAEAEVDVNWSQSQGISLDAVGRVYVEPALRFDLRLVAEASLLGFSEEWTKTLAQKEFGSGLRYGLEFPVHYQQGQPFDISMDDLRVIKPEIDISEAFSRFAGELFE